MQMKTLTTLAEACTGYSESKLPLLHRVFRYLVFLPGDLRWLGWDKFPFMLGWYSWRNKVSLDEALHVTNSLVEPGDILLHRDEGYLSNLAIGGSLIHAGLAVEDGMCVEAISEGVVRRSAAHLLWSDYSCVLRPLLPAIAKEKAVETANQLVGFPYDYFFDFNGPKHRDLIAQYGPDAKDHGVRFCCTEIPYFCYMDFISTLQLERRRTPTMAHTALSWCGLSTGEWVIDADMYMRANTDIVWCSKSMQPPFAQGEGYEDKLAAYWQR